MRSEMGVQFGKDVGMRASWGRKQNREEVLGLESQ